MKNLIVFQFQLCQVFKSTSESVSKIKCLHNIPSDIFIEIIEELGGDHDTDNVEFVDVWRLWSESQYDHDQLMATENSFLLTKLHSNYLGSWTPHTHGHQLIVSTFKITGDHVYVGQSDGTVQHFIVSDPTFSAENDIFDGAVREVEIWFKEKLLIVAGDHYVHFLNMNDLSINKVVNTQCEENKHISCFGSFISFCDGLRINISQLVKSELSSVCSVRPTSQPIQWKLWTDKMIVLESQGEISIYSVNKKPELVYSTEPNVMVMYKNPCYMFRDVIFCSTSAVVGLIVRTSYWLLGWQLHHSEKRLHRALDQDKIHPQDEVGCVALRRNIIVCGTEGGCISVFSNDNTETVDDHDQYNDVQLKRGHSVVQLEFDCYKVPLFKKQVSSRPILAVDVGFSGDKTFIFYRTNIQTMSCLTLRRKS